MLAGWLTGLGVFAIAVHWLSWITPIGYVAAVLYLSGYWLLAAWWLRGAFRRGVRLWWALPVTWVALEYVRAYVISGFPWFFLGHTQYVYPRLIQVADVTGAYGVSFFVAMVNGLAIDLLARPAPASDRPGWVGKAVTAVRAGWAGLAATVLVGGALLAYGTFRLAEHERRTTPGLTIAVVQGAFPISLGGRSSGEDMFDFHVARSRQLPLDQLDVLVWPETVLPWRFDEDWQGWDEATLARQPDLNAGMRRYMAQMRRQQLQLADLLGSTGTPLLAGGMTLHPGSSAAEPRQCNSTLLLRAAGGRLKPIDKESKYDKMHCVPFSEYVPFREGWPWLHRVLRAFVPPSMPQVTPGRRVTRFSAGRGKAGFSVATPICYEGTFARVCRAMCYERPGGGAGPLPWVDTLTGRGRPAKKVVCLINMSNDGWFIMPWGGQRASSELDQHWVPYVFRAIENRVPVARAVNTGISGFIDSCGRTRGQVAEPGTGRRKMVTGTAVRQILVDRRVSVYSSIGDLGAQVCLAIGVIGLLLRWRARRLSARRTAA